MRQLLDFCMALVEPKPFTSFCLALLSFAACIQLAVVIFQSVNCFFSCLLFSRMTTHSVHAADGGYAISTRQSMCGQIKMTQLHCLLAQPSNFDCLQQGMAYVTCAYYICTNLIWTCLLRYGQMKITSFSRC